MFDPLKGNEWMFFKHLLRTERKLKRLYFKTSQLEHLIGVSLSRTQEDGRRATSATDPV